MSFATADLCDAHEDQLALGTLRVLEPVFHLFSRAECFSGEAVTLKVFEDNAYVTEFEELPVLEMSEVIELVDMPTNFFPDSELENLVRITM